MRPLALGEVEAGLAISIAKGVVHGEGAGLRVHLDQIETRLRASHDQALRLGVPSCPVRAIGVADRQPRYFYRLCAVADVEHDQAVNLRYALNEETTGDGRHPTPIAWIGIDELGMRLVRIDVGDALDTAAECLHDDRTIRP